MAGYDGKLAAGRLAAVGCFAAGVAAAGVVLAAALPAAIATESGGVVFAASYGRAALAGAPSQLPPPGSPSPDPSPSASPSGPPTVASVGSGRWSDTTVEVRLTSPGWDPAQVLTYWRIDDSQWVQGTELAVCAPRDHAGDGLHAVEFYSTDLAGDPGPTAAIEVGIDTRRPKLAWRRLSPDPVGNRRCVRAVFTARDISPSLRFTYVVEDAWGHQAARRAGIVRRPGRCVAPIALRYNGGRQFLPGLYRVTVSVTDRAGNRTVSRARSLRVQHPVTATVWRRIAGAGPRVAVTFDDGNSTAAWSSILATLRRGGVHATFFINGVHVAGSPSLARRTVADGNAIGSHTYLHPELTAVGAARVYQEVVNDRNVWWRVARASPLPLFRPPYGSYDAATLRAVGRAGYARVILWDVDPADWRGPSSTTIAQSVLSRARPGSIILLHVQPSTAAALPAILGGLRARGLRPVTLPALFRAAGLRI